MGYVYLCACLAIAALAAVPASARTFVVHGPGSYGRSTSAPQDVTSTFFANPSLTTYSIAITDSTESSAVVTLNGVDIFSPNDFNGQVTQVSKTVAVRSENTLRVQLRGAPDSGFTLRVL